MTDSRWITEKRGDVAKLLVDALSLIGHQSHLPSGANSGQTSPLPTNIVPTLNLHNLNSPHNTQGQNYDVVPRLKFNTSPEKRCLQCSFVCTSCGYALSARDDALSISVLSDRISRSSSGESAKMLLDEYPGVYQNSNDKEGAKESVKRQGFIENSILRSAGLSFDNSRNQQLATLKDDLITKGGFRPQEVPLHKYDSSDNSSDSSPEGEIVSILCIDPEEYLTQQEKVKEQQEKARRVPEETGSSGSTESINDGPYLFGNSSLTNPTSLTLIKEDKKPKPLQDAQLSPFEEKQDKKKPPVNGQRVLPDLTPLLKHATRVASPGKSPSDKRKVSLGFTASEFPQQTLSESGSQSVEPVKSKTRGKGFKKIFSKCGWKK